jgi:uncharacterized protein (TIGR00730 family)
VSTPTIAVFGSSEPRPGQPAYELARRVGSLLAAASFAVITGGYGGVMEAASRGAREAGGRTIGVPCDIFERRLPNAFLSEVVPSRDLFDRSRELIERAGGFVVLPGKAGTLSELSLLWALQRAGCLDGRPVVLLGACWKPFLQHLSSSEMLEPSQLRATTVANTPEEAVRSLTALLRGPEA